MEPFVYCLAFYCFLWLCLSLPFFFRSPILCFCPDCTELFSAVHRVFFSFSLRQSFFCSFLLLILSFCLSLSSLHVSVSFFCDFLFFYKNIDLLLSSLVANPPVKETSYFVKLIYMSDKQLFWDSDVAHVGMHLKFKIFLFSFLSNDCNLGANLSVLWHSVSMHMASLLLLVSPLLLMLLLCHWHT